MSELADGSPAGVTPDPGRYRVSLDLEMGFDGQPSDDTDFNLDPDSDLAVAVAKILGELRTMSPSVLELDWGMEPGRLQLTVLDTKTNERHIADFYWEAGEWHED